MVKIGIHTRICEMMTSDGVNGGIGEVVQVECPVRLNCRR